MRERPRTLPTLLPLIAMTGALLSAWPAQAEQLAAPPDSPADASPAWTIQVDPLTTALGFVHVQLERAISPHWSVYAGPHLRLYDSVLSDTSEPYKGYGVELGARWFYAGRAPEGLWVGARAVGAWAVGPSSGSPAGYVSALGGYTLIVAKRLVLSGGLGAQYLHYRVDGLGPRGVFPALHTAVGLAF